MCSGYLVSAKLFVLLHYAVCVHQSKSSFKESLYVGVFWGMCIGMLPSSSCLTMLN